MLFLYLKTALGRITHTLYYIIEELSSLTRVDKYCIFWCSPEQKETTFKGFFFVIMLCELDV